MKGAVYYTKVIFRVFFAGCTRKRHKTTDVNIGLMYEEKRNVGERRGNAKKGNNKLGET